MDDEAKTGLRKILLLVGALLALFMLLTCFYQVRMSEAAVLTTFEKPVRNVTEPGLHVKWPWPVQKAYLFDMRRRLYQAPYMEFLVRDGFNVVVRVFACWRVRDVGLYKNKVGVTLARGESILADILAKNLKIVLSEHPLSDLVGIDNGDNGTFDPVESDIRTRVADEASANYGLEVSVVGFDRLELPENTTEVVFERMKSERMKMVEKILSEGQYQAQKIRKDADSAKNKILAEAEARATTIRGEADTAAFEYLDVYTRHPELALFLRKLEALENTLKTKTTVVLDRDVPPFDMLAPGASTLGQEAAPGTAGAEGAH